jgi:flagellar hook-length control protein FliK
VPHVASHANAHAVSHAHAHARAHRQAEHAPASPFEELLEDVAVEADQPAPQASELAAALLPPQAEGDSKAAKPPADPANATLHAPHAEITAPPAADAAIAALANVAVNRLAVQPDPKPAQIDATTGVKPAVDDNSAKIKTNDAGAQIVQAAPVPDAPPQAAAIAPVLAPAPVADAPTPPPQPSPDVIIANAAPPSAQPLPEVVIADVPKLAAAAPLATLAAPELAPPKLATNKAADGAASPDVDAAPGPEDNGKTAAAAPAAPGPAAKPDTRGRGESAPALRRDAPTADAPVASQREDHAASKLSSDVTQLLNASAPPQASAPALQTSAPAPLAPPAAAVPLAGIAIAIAGKVLEGNNRFEIRLDPPELGRIEVKLDLDRDGRITSHIVADRPATLELLRNDVATLQRALDDAGLKTANNGLQFSLRDQNQQQQQQQQQQQANAASVRLMVDDPALSALDPVLTRNSAHSGGLDIRV